MKILLISDNRFPDADAGAVREHVLASMLIREKHTLYRVGRFCDKKANIDNIRCISVPDKGKNSKGNKINLLLFNYNVLKLVKKSHKQYHFDAFLITGCKARLVKALKRFAIKNNIKLVYNAVEYYSEEQFKYGKFARQFINNRTIANDVIDKNFRVIGISTFLQELFLKRGIETIRIPFILNKETVKCNFSSNDKVEIAYVGRPSRSKDYLKEFIDAMSKLSKNELEKIHLTLVGVNRQQLNNNYAISEETLEYIGNSITAKGLLVRGEAMKILSNVDFTILYRSDKEVYAKAGFPTKVTESLMSGVPVITNLTSDLGMYIKDGKNGLVIEEKEDIVECYRKAINMSKEKIYEMKLNARAVAEKDLDSQNYIKELNLLFEK